MQGLGLMLYRPLPLYASLDKEDECTLGGASDSKLQLGVAITQIWTLQL